MPPVNMPQAVRPQEPSEYGGSSMPGFSQQPVAGIYPDDDDMTANPATVPMPTSYGPSSPPEPPVFPGFSRFNDGLKCEQCGAEFTDAEGLKEGDDCPKCAGGDPTKPSGSTRYRSNRVLFKGIEAIIALAVGGVSWLVKKMVG